MLSRIGSLEKKAAANGAPAKLKPPQTNEEEFKGVDSISEPVLEQD